MVVIFRSPLTKKNGNYGRSGLYAFSCGSIELHIELQPTARDQELTQEMVEKERRLDEMLSISLNAVSYFPLKIHPPCFSLCHPAHILKF